MLIFFVRVNHIDITIHAHDYSDMLDIIEKNFINPVFEIQKVEYEKFENF